jgi:hypothetical protein
LLRLVEAPDQKEAPDFEEPRVRRVNTVAMLFEARSRSVESLRRPAQFARGKCDLSLGNNTPRAGHGLFRTEGARCTSHEYFRPNKVAKPCKRNPSKRKSRRVAAQSDPVQRTEGITRLQRTRCGPD